MDQPGKVANPARGHPCSRLRLRIWSRETGSVVASRVSLLISILRLNMVLTYGIPPAFRGGVNLFILNRHTPSGPSRVYRVTHLRTDGVHCRESAGIGPVNLKVVPATGAAFSCITIGRCCFFPTPTRPFDTPCKEILWHVEWPT